MSKLKKFQDDSEKVRLLDQMHDVTGKIKFLNTIKSQIISDSALPVSFERDFIDKGLNDLYEKIRKASQGAVVGIINDQIREEENVLSNLMESLKEAS